MAGKFMKIKKIVIPFITLVIMTSQLAGCATMTSQEMLKTMQESPEVSIEYAVPDTGQQDGQQSLDGSGVVDIGDTQTIVDSNGTAVGVIDQQQEAKELSGAELESYFQLAYDSGAALEGDLETRILGELDILISLVDSDATIKLPSNYSSQYRDWRPAEEVDPFTEVNEQVWATGTVNLRNGAGTSFDKVGSLNAGDSVTRIGIGTGEAEGWSRIQLSNGNIVYVSNSYLSTTKPVVQQQQPSGGTQQQTQQPTQSGSQQQPQPSGGQSQEDKNRADNEAAGQGLAGLKQWGEQHQGTGDGFYSDLPEGATIDENGNVTDPSVRVQS